LAFGADFVVVAQFGVAFEMLKVILVWRSDEQVNFAQDASLLRTFLVALVFLSLKLEDTTENQIDDVVSNADLRMGVDQAPQTLLEKVAFDELQLPRFTDRHLFAVLVNYVVPILPNCQIDVTQLSLFQ